MMVGFFMIVLDGTIVAVANPSIMAALHTGYDTVIWVTSAYLLANAVPLLVAGRLGDRFGPKNLYLIGLAGFTGASLWCGLSGSIGVLIAARVVQGIGAGLLTPQTLSTITQTFRPERRGVALSVWGATAGVASLAGPLAGGVLVDTLGWKWIFFVNVPIGVAGVVLALWLIPRLPTHTHRFDVPGVGLSGAGVFLIVFALQQGQSAGWAPWIWAVLVGGAGFIAVFVYWQSVNTGEPLIPLDVFRDRNFSLANLAVAIIGFAVTAMVLPVMFYAQGVCGLSPTRSALLIAPMALASGLLAPAVGKIIDRSHPRPVVGFGFSLLAIALTWLSIEMGPAAPIWRLVLPFTAMGVGMAFIWSPLTATATRNLPSHLAGTGSGVYNTTRQLGAVLGSASMAAFMVARIGAEMPATPSGARPQPAGGTSLQLPEILRAPFAAAMAQSTLLPAFVALFGVVTALFMVGDPPSPDGRQSLGSPGGTARSAVTPANDVCGFDAFCDDDDYVEYTLVHEPGPPHADAESSCGEDDTEPLRARLNHSVTRRHADSVQARHRLPDHQTDGISRLNRNGFHVDDEQRFRSITNFSAPPAIGDHPRSAAAHSSTAQDRDESLWNSGAWHQPFTTEAPPRNKHHRPGPDGPAARGRHSFPDGR
nr:MFS transporter [Mycobacterium botniense]